MLSSLAIAVGDRFDRRGRVVVALRPAYGAWLNAVYGRRGMPWQLNGEPLRIDPMVRHLLPQHNERPLFEYLRSSIRTGETIFDVGAFLGSYAIFEARWAGASGRVIAFEPSEFSFGVLKRHVAMNRLGPDRVEARHAAVGRSVGTRRLITFDAEPYRNQVAGDASQDGHVDVDMVSIDAMSAALGRPPDWIRMDVQGLEFDVLEGARDTIREARGRIRIVVETHPEQWAELGVEPDQAHALFASHGFRARPIDSAEPLFSQGGHVVLEPLH